MTYAEDAPNGFNKAEKNGWPYQSCSCECEQCKYVKNQLVSVYINDLNIDRIVNEKIEKKVGNIYKNIEKMLVRLDDLEKRFDILDNEIEESI